jgi:hypothetical protein
MVSSKSSGFNLWISDLILDNEKLFSSRLFVDGIFCCLKMGYPAAFSKDGLPNKKHTSERYNYFSMHGNQLVAFHVPQVLQQ